MFFKDLVAAVPGYVEAAQTAKTESESLRDETSALKNDTLNLKSSVDVSKTEVEAYAQDMLLHVQIDVYDPDTAYAFPKAVIGDDGETYRCLQPIESEITGVIPTDDGVNWRRISNAFPAILDGGAF